MGIISKCREEFNHVETYVLMMAKINVPQGRLQESSRRALSPVIALVLVPSAKRLGL